MALQEGGVIMEKAKVVIREVPQRLYTYEALVELYIGTNFDFVAATGWWCFQGRGGDRAEPVNDVGDGHQWLGEILAEHQSSAPTLCGEEPGRSQREASSPHRWRRDTWAQNRNS